MLPTSTLARPLGQQGVIDWLENELDQVEAILPMLVLVLAAVMIIVTYAKTRAFVPTLVAAILGAFLWVAVTNIEWFGERVQDEILEEDAPAGLGVRPEGTATNG